MWAETESKAVNLPSVVFGFGLWPPATQGVALGLGFRV